MKETNIEDLYAIAKRAYGKTIDLKLQLEFLMKNINDFAENSARIKEQTEKENLNGNQS